MKRRILIASVFAFQFAVLGSMAPAIANDWELMAERSVRLVNERDIIPIGGRKQYARLKLKVKETGIQILSMSIRLATGQVLNPPLRTYIGKNKESRVIDIPGKDRAITSVTLVYQSRPGSRERAIVQLYGKTR
jgi:hypothetical protein